MRSVHDENGPPIEKAKTVNITGLSLEEIENLPRVGVCKNLWRNRWVTLYRYDDARVVSVGCAFDNLTVVILLEPNEAHTWTLRAFPRTYTHE